MPNSVLTLPNIKEEVQILLGASGVDVELTPADLRKCVIDALRLYSRTRPFKGNRAIAVTPAQKKYGPIDTLHPGFQGVSELRFVHAGGAVPTEVDPFNPEDTLTAGLLFGSETFGEMHQRLAYTEDARKIVGSEPEWQGMWEEDNHYYLYVSVARSNMLASYVWTGHYVLEAPASPPAQGVLLATSIPDGDTDWIIDFATARAKQILARIRGKYEGIPNPEGSVDSVDWSTLQSEGREDEDRLKEEIKARRRQLPPIQG